VEDYPEYFWELDSTTLNPMHSNNGREDLTIDCCFHGLTRLNCPEGEIIAECVFSCFFSSGLDRNLTILCDNEALWLLPASPGMRMDPGGTARAAECGCEISFPIRSEIFGS